MIGLDQAIRPELCLTPRWPVATGLARRRVSTYLVEFMRRMRRLNPYRPATDTGLLKIFALVAVMILIFISGAFDCRFQFIYVGFC